MIEELTRLYNESQPNYIPEIFLRLQEAAARGEKAIVFKWVSEETIAFLKAQGFEATARSGRDKYWTNISWEPKI